MEMSQKSNSLITDRVIPNPKDNLSSTKKQLTKIECQIKLGGFQPYENIGVIPQKFTDLVKIISKIVFPKNFSLNYFCEDLSIIPISDAKEYKSLLKFSAKNNLNVE